MPTSNRSALVWGVVLVLLGLVFLLNNLNVLPSPLLDWWPLLVMGAGLLLLGQSATRRRGGGLVGGLLLLALGVFWLLNNFGRVDDRYFVPVLLIALGTGLLLRRFIEPQSS